MGTSASEPDAPGRAQGGGTEHLREALIAASSARSAERRKRVQLESVLEGLRSMSTTPDLGAVFREVVNLLRTFIEFDAAFLNAQEPGSISMPTVATTSPLFADFSWRPGQTFKRLLQGIPVTYFDTELVEEWRAQGPKNIHEHARSALHLPIRTGSAPAILTCVSASPGAFSQQEVKAVSRLGPILSQTLINVQHRVELEGVIAQKSRALESAEQARSDIQSDRGQLLQAVSAEIRRSIEHIEASLRDPQEPESMSGAAAKATKAVTGAVREAIGDLKYLTRTLEASATRDSAPPRSARSVFDPVEVARNAIARAASKDPLSTIEFHPEGALPERARGLATGLSDIIERLLGSFAASQPGAKVELRVSSAVVGTERIVRYEIRARAEGEAVPYGACTGLALWRSAVETMGGVLGLRGGDGSDNALWVHIPCDLEAEATRADDAHKAAGVLIPRPAARVLIVQAHPVTAMGTLRKVQALGHDGEIATSAEDANARLHGEVFTHVMVDAGVEDLDSPAGQVLLAAATARHNVGLTVLGSAQGDPRWDNVTVDGFLPEEVEPGTLETLLGRARGAGA